VVLQSIYPTSIGWAWGLTSGVIALALNFLVYAGCAVFLPASAEERSRVAGLFDLTSSKTPSASAIGALALKPRRA
jgi:SSS family solute:Na+ symporter